MNTTTTRMYLIWADSALALTKNAMDVIRTDRDMSNEGHQTVLFSLHGANDAFRWLRQEMDNCGCPEHDSGKRDELLLSVIRAGSRINAAIDLIGSDLHFCAETDLEEAERELHRVSEVLNLRISLPELADS
jgi:hypothetical protein